MEDSPSSPDPLNDDTYLFPAKVQRSSRANQSSFSLGNTPKKQTFQLNVGDELSPHRIRVTVQAEDPGVENTHSRMNSSPSRKASKQRERALTATKLFKDHSDFRDITKLNDTPKNGRGYQKKPAATSSTKTKKRAHTPNKRTRGGSIMGSVGVDDGDYDAEFKFDTEKGDQIRRRVRSRLESVNDTSRTTPLTDKSKHVTKTLSSSKNRKSKGRRKTTRSFEAILEGRSGHTELATSERPHKADPAFEQSDKNRENNSPTNITPDYPVSLENNDSDNMRGRSITNEEAPRTIKWWSPHLAEHSNSIPRSKENQYPSPYSPDKLNSQKIEDKASHVDETQFDKSTESPDNNEEDANEYREENGAGEFREFDSILEGEGFSMISADSVLSLKEHMKCPERQPDQFSVTDPKRTEKPVSKDYDQRAPLMADPELPDRFTSRKGFNDIASLHKHIPIVDYSALYRTSVIYQEKSPDINSEVSQSVGRNILRDDDSFSSIAHKTHREHLPARTSRKKPSFVNISKASDSEEYSFSAAPAPILHGTTPIELHASNVSSSQSYPSSNKNQPAPKIRVPEENILPREQFPEYLSQTEDARTSNDLFMKDGIENLLVPTQLSSSPPSVVPQDYTALSQKIHLNSNDAQIKSVRFSSQSLPISAELLGGGLHQALPPEPIVGCVRQNLVIPSSPRTESSVLKVPIMNQLTEQEPKEVFAEDPNMTLESDHHSNSFGSSFRTLERPTSPEESRGESQQLEFSSPSPVRLRQSAINPSQVRQYFRSSDAKAKSGDYINTSNDFMSSKTKKIASVASKQKIIEDRDTDLQELTNLDSINVPFIHSDESEEDEDFNLLLETLNSSSRVSPRVQEIQENIYERQNPPNYISPWKKSPRRFINNGKKSNLESCDTPNQVNLTSEAALQPVTTISIPDETESDELKNARVFSHQVSQVSNIRTSAQSTPDRSVPVLLSESSSQNIPKISTQCGNSLIEQKSRISSPQLNSNCESVYSSNVERKDNDNTLSNTGTLDIDVQSEPASSLQEQPLSSQKLSEEILSTEPTDSFSKEASESPGCITSNSQAIAQISPVMSQRNSMTSPPITINGRESILKTSRAPKSAQFTISPVSASHGEQTANVSSPLKSCLHPSLKSPSACSPTPPRSTPGKVVTFVSSSLTTSSPLYCPLSATIWTRNHWLVLDKIVQRWKPGTPLGLCATQARCNGLARPRNSTRVISKLLGRSVSGAHGEHMKLEQWHLEAIDEFRSIVPGWEEKVVAKRVYALLVGEKIRAEKRTKDARETAASVSSRPLRA